MGQGKNGHEQALGLGTASLAEWFAGRIDPEQLTGLFEDILVTVPVAIALIEAGPELPYVYANGAYERWAGADPGSLVGQARSVGPNATPADMALLAEVVATGETRQLPSGRGRAGSDAWEWHIHPLKDSHRVVTHLLETGSESGADSGARDHEMDELRAHGERLVALDKLKSDFLHLATHELRSPLAIVSGYLSMLASGVGGEVTPRMERLLEPLTRNVELMAELVNELMETARLDEGQVDQAGERIDLRELLADATAPVRRSEAHELRLSVTADGAYTVGDRRQLTRVFANLVDNAVKYSPRGGEIAVTLATDEHGHCVEVADHGIGIAEEDMERLFTRFGRIATDETRAISGTGLGLYLCREIVRRHGGDVTATSVRSKGSTFTVRLPAFVAAEESALPAGVAAR